MTIFAPDPQFDSAKDPTYVVGQLLLHELVHDNPEYEGVYDTSEKFLATDWKKTAQALRARNETCLLSKSPTPQDGTRPRTPSSP